LGFLSIAERAHRSPSAMMNRTFYLQPGKVLRARGFTAKLNGLVNFWLTMLLATSLTGSMQKLLINPALAYPLNAVATHL